MFCYLHSFSFLFFIVSAGHALARWRLHQQFKKDKYSNSIRMEMEIRTTTPADNDSDDSLADSLGAFDLHYLETVKEPSGNGGFGHYGKSYEFKNIVPLLHHLILSISYQMPNDSFFYRA